MLAFLLGLINPLSRILDTIDAKIDSDVEKERIKTEAAISFVNAKADVIRTGMQNKLFWIPWLMAAVPTAAWFGLGMLDSVFNGGLPDVATLPPQLKEYADIVWQNIFISGAVVGGSTVIASAIKANRR